MTTVYLAVNGTLMRGLALNPNLLQVGAQFVREDKTDAAYRLWTIGDRHPAMMRFAQGGREIALEIWSLPAAAIATILQQEPAGLCIGFITLTHGENMLGVLGEAYLCESGQEITQWGGWRAYIANKQDATVEK